MITIVNEDWNVNVMRVFPQLKAENLNREMIEIPSQLRGEINIVMVAFQQWQQGLVDSWVPFLESLIEIHENMDYYELPTIRKMNVLYRRFIDGGMRAGIQSRGTRERTITLYIDKDPFKEALDIVTEETIYVYLIDREGKILWETQGGLSEEKAESLETALGDILGTK
nr:MAG: hypothetical protein AM325_01600 [Candidatus Thorarchaeota archaeon SMTZ1-45]